MSFLKRFCMLALLTGLLLSGCGGRVQIHTEEKGQKLNVVTTIFPYYDFSRQIAGSRIELTMVVPAGMDSHSFEPTPADMQTIQNADILICNGGEMEHWLSQVLEAVDTSDMTIISMMDYVETFEETAVEGMEDDGYEDHGHEDEEEAHASHDGHKSELLYDEHIWTSPVNAMKASSVISDAFQKADPDGREAYSQNETAYVEKLKQLDSELKEIAGNRQRDMIIVADKFPFRYLAQTYGLDYRAAFTGCSTDTEPSAKTIAYLIDKIKQDKIPVVYYLELSSHRVAEIIHEETGAKPLLLHSCHNVTRAEFDAGITYLELMKQNAANLKEGLDK